MLISRTRLATAGLTLCLISAGWPGAALAQAQCEGPATRYTVSRSGDDAFQVRAELAQPSGRFDVFYFPVEGRPEGQADSVSDLHAYDAAGAELALAYVGEGGWEIEDAQASSLSYRLLADHDAVDWGNGGPGKDEVATRFDHSYFFAGHAFFLVDFEAPACPIEIAFDLPSDWVVTSPWPMDGHIATASGPYNLAQNVFAMGEDLPSEGDIGGMRISWLVADALADQEPRITELMDALPRVYAEFWGGPSADRFATFFFPDRMSDGGAFEESFAMRLAAPVTPTDERIWAHTLGHEIMHLWNLRNAPSWPDVDSIYWYSEGFTDYLTLKLMSQAGLLPEGMLEQRLANILRRYEIAKRLSPGVSLAEAGYDKLTNWELIYGGGALMALMLDAEVSQSDPLAFRDALRTVRNDGNEPYDQPRLIAALDAETDGRASAIQSWIDSEPDFAEIRARLAAVGIAASNFRFDEVYVDFPACAAETCVPDFLAPRSE
jgi:predicted metalloprotease with PDZ domain